MSPLNPRFFFIFLLLSGFYSANAQSLMQDKAYYDSLKLHRFSGLADVGLTLNDDGTRQLNITSDLAFGYVTKRGLLELTENFFFNSLDRFNTSNRLSITARAALWRHKAVNNTIVNEKHFFPEIIGGYLYDEGRGLNYRFFSGINMVYNNFQTKDLRFKIGLGLIHENESWRIIDREYLPALDTLSQPVLDALKQLLGIDNKGNLVRDNWRLNSYVQLWYQKPDKISVNALIGCQLPFQPPYKGLYPFSFFPTVDKLYPRISVDISLSVPLSRRISLTTSFMGRFDKGQLSPFVEKIFIIYPKE